MALHTSNFRTDRRQKTMDLPYQVLDAIMDSFALTSASKALRQHSQTALCIVLNPAIVYYLLPSHSPTYNDALDLSEDSIPPWRTGPDISYTCVWLGLRFVVATLLGLFRCLLKLRFSISRLSLLDVRVSRYTARY